MATRDNIYLNNSLHSSAFMKKKTNEYEISKKPIDTARRLMKQELMVLETCIVLCIYIKIIIYYTSTFNLNTGW